MEPGFPLQVPPTCRECGKPCLRSRVSSCSKSGNAGRFFYSCADREFHTWSVFGCFDDAIGISRDNPPCPCGYVSRRTGRTDGESHFFSCPIGRCGWSLTDYTTEGTPSPGVLGSLIMPSSPVHNQAGLHTPPTLLQSTAFLPTPPPPQVPSPDKTATTRNTTSITEHEPATSTVFPPSILVGIKSLMLETRAAGPAALSSPSNPTTSRSGLFGLTSPPSTNQAATQISSKTFVFGEASGSSTSSAAFQFGFSIDRSDSTPWRPSEPCKPKRAQPGTVPSEGDLERPITATRVADSDSDKGLAGANMELTAPGLADLPFDILRMIVWNERLPQTCVAALRLTCRALANVAVTRLFYRISISKLNTDREAFLAVCSRPHLAYHVHEVEWLEISYDVNLFDRIADQFSSWPPTTQEDAPLLSYLRSQAKQSFWMTNVPPFLGDFDGGDTDAARQATVATFRGPFIAAVDMLPNLHTFISRPMTSSRIINPGAEYEMTADLLQRFQTCPEPPATPQTNDGLFLFLIPAMNRPSSPVTRLRWADEFPGASYRRPLPASAFERLESLELCFVSSLLIIDTHVSDLRAACIHAAPSLRHLTLCMEHGACDSLTDMERMILGPGLVLAPSCQLRSLSLVDVTCEPDVLYRAIKANARSLRHLHLNAMHITAKFLQRLAKLHALKLDTMQVVDVDDGSRTCCARALVRYVNAEPSGKPCHHASSVANRSFSCDEEIRQLMEDDTSPCIATQPAAYIESDSDSDASSEDSTPPLPAPKWAWARFFHGESRVPTVFCYQVPDSHPEGHATEWWKFTSRSGEIAQGRDPLVWFEDWDPEEGDVAEPTPYCRALYHFVEEIEPIDDIARYLGQASVAWDFIKNLEPPEGAIQYNPPDDPAADEYWEWYAKPMAPTVLTTVH